MKTRIVVGALLVFLSTCGDSSGSGSIDEPCGGDGDCQSGFVCPKSGDYKGRCTMRCATSSDCTKRFSDSYACVAGDVCAKRCGTRDGACPSGMSCDSGFCEVPEPDER